MTYFFLSLSANDTRLFLAAFYKHALGTTLRYTPGLVLGGQDFTHDCSQSRGVGYLLDVLLFFGLYAKKVGSGGLAMGGYSDMNNNNMYNVMYNNMNNLQSTARAVAAV